MAGCNTPFVNCPSCSGIMTTLTFDTRLQTPVTIDMCATCQSFWFDTHESLKLSPASTLKLIKLIGENTARGGVGVFNRLRCPRCNAQLMPTKDLQRNTRFSYWRCDSNHGRFIRFFEFLKEKSFIQQLSREQVEELRRHVQAVNCSNCGAPVDLTRTAACAHCGTPLSMIDMKQPEELMKQLEKASVPRPIDPLLPLELARAKRDVDATFRGMDSNSDWWSSASASGLVEAGLGAVARWLAKSGI
jgi:hypothetical protein